MSRPTVVVITAGLSQPSSTRLLGDRLAAAVSSALGRRGPSPEVEVVELREHARELTNQLLTGFAPAALTELVERIRSADALVAVTPIFSASYSGLFKMFFDLLPVDLLVGKPTLIAATAGSARTRSPSTTRCDRSSPTCGPWWCRPRSSRRARTGPPRVPWTSGSSARPASWPPSSARSPTPQPRRTRTGRRTRRRTGTPRWSRSPGCWPLAVAEINQEDGVMAVEISDHPEQSRYEARQGAELAGVAAYERSGGVITFTHTVVPDAFEGQGVGSALARTALDEARTAGVAVVPRCSFIAGWIDRHPEYADLVRDA